MCLRAKYTQVKNKTNTFVESRMFKALQKETRPILFQMKMLKLAFKTIKDCFGGIRKYSNKETNLSLIADQLYSQR